MGRRAIGKLPAGGRRPQFHPAPVAGGPSFTPQFTIFEARNPAHQCLCLRFDPRLATWPAKLEVRPVRYSFPVGLFHSLLHCRFIPALGRSRPSLATLLPQAAGRLDESHRCHTAPGPSRWPAAILVWRGSGYAGLRSTK